MSPRTKEQFEQIRESRQQQIMDAGLELFAEQGYANCSIAQLARHTGISKGLMYNYFESKEALLSSIIEDGISEILDYFDPNHDGILSPEEMAGFIRKIFSAIRMNQQFWVLYINIVLQPRVREYLEGQPFNSLMDDFGPMLTAYFAKKGFKDPALEMLTFSSLIEGFGVLMVYAHPGEGFPDELVNRFENRIIEMYT